MILPVIVSAEVSASDCGDAGQRAGVEDIARALASGRCPVPAGRTYAGLKNTNAPRSFPRALPLVDLTKLPLLTISQHYQKLINLNSQ